MIAEALKYHDHEGVSIHEDRSSAHLFPSHSQEYDDQEPHRHDAHGDRLWRTERRDEFPAHQLSGSSSQQMGINGSHLTFTVTGGSLPTY